jgi:O-methyltransferase involved in polyketide biosynthesis
MDSTRASLTALGAVHRRAYHDAHDSPKVFEDRLAALFVSPDEAPAIGDGLIHILTRVHPELVVAGDRTATLARAHHTDTGTPLVLGRARYNEDLLETAIRHGVTQYVIVGAGFDTFALRRPDLRERLTVFELDHPSLVRSGRLCAYRVQTGGRSTRDRTTRCPPAPGETPCLPHDPPDPRGGPSVPATPSVVRVP